MERGRTCQEDASAWRQLHQHQPRQAGPRPQLQGCDAIQSCCPPVQEVVCQKESAPPDLQADAAQRSGHAVLDARHRLPCGGGEDAGRALLPRLVQPLHVHLAQVNLLLLLPLPLLLLLNCWLVARRQLQGQRRWRLRSGGGSAVWQWESTGMGLFSGSFSGFCRS